MSSGQSTDNNSGSESRIRVGIQAFATTTIIGSAALIDKNHPVLQELVRNSAPLSGIILGALVDYYIRRVNYSREERRLGKILAESKQNHTNCLQLPPSEERIPMVMSAAKNVEYWEEKLKEHRANGAIKIEI